MKNLIKTLYMKDKLIIYFGENKIKIVKYDNYYHLLKFKKVFWIFGQWKTEFFYGEKDNMIDEVERYLENLKFKK